MKPAILIDVDGPLNPYNAKTLPEGYTAHTMRPDSWTAIKPLKVLLNPSHGPSLMGLGAELIWATTWEYEADEWIGSHLGLPKLSVINWVERDYWNKEGLYWKTKRIAEWMKKYRPGVPFIWIDDECTNKDNKWLLNSTNGLGSTLQVSPKWGLREQEFVYLKLWREKWLIQ